MKLRDQISKKMKIRAILMGGSLFLTVLFFMFPMIAPQIVPGWKLSDEAALSFMIPALVAFAFYHYLKKRPVACPNCAKVVAGLVAMGPSENFGIGLPEEVKFCPFCSIDFDSSHDASTVRQVEEA